MINELAKSYATRSTRNRLGDTFYVQFLGLPENVSNVLGRQVRTVNRPEVRFEESEVLRRGNQYKEKGFVRFNPVSITFWDDEGAIVSSILYAQVMRQLNHHTDVMGTPADTSPDTRDYKFDIKVDLMNPEDKVIESFILKRCFLTELNHDSMNIDDDSEVMITATFAYDNIDYKIFDEYIEMKSSL
jgi:hypothetical protein